MLQANCMRYEDVMSDLRENLVSDNHLKITSIFYMQIIGTWELFINKMAARTPDLINCSKIKNQYDAYINSYGWNINDIIFSHVLKLY